jgi:hypothetical protein
VHISNVVNVKNTWSLLWFEVHAKVWNLALLMFLPQKVESFNLLRWVEARNSKGLKISF